MNPMLPQNRLGRLNALVNASKIIERPHLLKERDLLTRKWFAYRFMSPLEATLQFGRLYNEARRASFRMNVDVETAGRLKDLPLSVPVANDGSFTQLWIARQRADEIGAPYEDYLEFCFEFANRRKRRHAPRPNQLHANERTAEAWLAEYEKFMNDRIGLAAPKLQDMPQYRLFNNQRLPAQLNLKEFIKNEISESSASLPRLAELWTVERQLFPLLGFRNLMPKYMFTDLVQALKSRRDEKSGRGVLPPPEAFWQACFGVPGAQDTRSAPCALCPQSKSCTSMAGTVNRALKNAVGSTDPVGDKKREQQRVRTTKSRLKKAEERSRKAPEPGECSVTLP